MGYAARYFAEGKHTDYFAWASFKLMKFMIVNRCEVAHRSTPLWELSIRWTISPEYRWVYGLGIIINIGWTTIDFAGTISYTAIRLGGVVVQINVTVLGF